MLAAQMVVFIYDPRDVELLLSSHVYIDKASEYKFFKPWLGDGLLISTGEGLKGGMDFWGLGFWGPRRWGQFEDHLPLMQFAES